MTGRARRNCSNRNLEVGVDSYLGANAREQQVRERAQKQARRNATAMAGVPERQSLTLEQRAGRWWDLPAKVQAANRLTDEELALHDGHHNDEGDALRHAEWSRRTSEAAGPGFTTAAGWAHEIEDLAPQLSYDRNGDYHAQFIGPISETAMDLRNNAEGRRAAMEGRPIDRSKLQTTPGLRRR
jgi:hypothetical protein